MAKSSLQDTQISKKKSWQTTVVVLVLAAFVLTGVILSEWRSGIFGEPTAAANAIAILPFENASQDAYTGNLADSLTAGIINEVSHNSNLQVVSLSDVQRYKGKTQDLGAIAKALKARAVLTGRIMREGDNLTIKTELVEMGSGSRLWGNEYNVPIAEVTKLPADISREIIAAASPAK
jgi:TolB-like protein